MLGQCYQQYFLLIYKFTNEIYFFQIFKTHQLIHTANNKCSERIINVCDHRIRHDKTSTLDARLGDSVHHYIFLDVFKFLVIKKQYDVISIHNFFSDVTEFSIPEKDGVRVISFNKEENFTEEKFVTPSDLVSGRAVEHYFA